MASLEETLKDVFSYDYFREGQREAVTAPLEGYDSLVMLPTGTGKSLCYQLPAYLMDGLTLIVSPLISLMQDQVESIKKRGERRVAALNSFNSRSERQAILQSLDQLKYLYLSPEMLMQKEVLGVLTRQKISLFVIDEAHCISQWGLDFRPEYLYLGEMRQKLNHPITMALTATATPLVREEIKQVLGFKTGSYREIVHSVNRPNIKLATAKVETDKYPLILEGVQGLEKPGIIYFSSKKMAEEVSQRLKEDTQMNIAFYHGDLEGEDRMKIQEKFMRDQVDIVCATSAFGMGIDKENIRFIIHYHMPGSLEEYVQEIGRAGRDGRDALAVLLYQDGDENIPKYFIEQSLPNRQMIHEVYQKDFRLEDERQSSSYFLKTMGFSQEEVQEVISTRYDRKHQQVQKMLSYVQEEGCLRQKILSYFGQSKELEDLCCSYCQENIVDSFLSESHHLVREEKQEESWQEILAEIFK